MRTTSARTDERLAAIVLAAGGSSRLGRPKQLLRYRGMPLILKAVRLAHGVAGAGVTVVIGSEHQRVRSLLRRRAGRLTVVRNSRWQDGISTSLRAGLAALRPTATAALILLVDQARLDSTDLARLVARWRSRPGHAAAAGYLGRAGAPAIIPRRWFRLAAGLAGDTGARQLLRTVGEPAIVEIPAAAFDVDTPADAIMLNS